MWEKVWQDGTKKLKWNAVPTVFARYTPAEIVLHRKAINIRYPCNVITIVL